MKRLFLILTALVLSCDIYAAGIVADFAAGDSLVAPESEEAKLEKDEATLVDVTKKVGQTTKVIAQKTYDVTKDFVTGKLKNYLDSSGVKGTDPAYIGLPKRKWRVSLTGDMDKMSVDVTSENGYATSIDQEESWNSEFHFHTPMSASTGVWVGYMGYGVGFSYLKSEQNNTNMTVNVASPNFGLNIRWIRYSTDHEFKGWAEKGMTFSELLKSKNYAYDITSFVFDGYWLFNKKKFSYSAAYDLSTVQLRSAGSFVAGLMVNYQKCDFANPDNVRLLAEANHVGKVNMFQGSIGGGYAYNWVPTPGLVINVTAMPVLTVYTRSKLYRYNWEMQYGGDEKKDVVGVTLTNGENYSENGKVAFNLNARLAAAYRYKYFVFSFLAQGHYLRSYFEDASFKVFQWNLKATVGITL